MMGTARAKRALKDKRSGQAATHASAVKAVVQILFATSRSYTIDSLRHELREFFLEESNYEKRAVASLSAVRLVSGLLDASPALAAIDVPEAPSIDQVDAIPKTIDSITDATV